MCASVIATWSFSLLAVHETTACLKRGENILDCLEKGINVVEDDPKTGKCVVGRGGFPNANGILECDAAIMDGNGCNFGAVAAIQGVSTPLSVARFVMEKSSHSLLVGEGAKQFAKDCQITIYENENLQTDSSQKAYQNFLKTVSKSNQDRVFGHDTLGLIVKDFQGNIAAGGAVATGDGDNIMRFCPCFKVVQLMKDGQSPKEACRHVIKDIWKRVGKSNMFEMAIVAVNRVGEVGAASSVNASSNFFGSDKYPGFAYSLWRSDENCSVPEIRCEPPVVWEDIEN